MDAVSGPDGVRVGIDQARHDGTTGGIDNLLE